MKELTIETAYMQSPIGVLKIEATQKSLVRLSVSNEFKLVSGNAITDLCIHQLNDYFTGRLKVFTIPSALNGTDFQVKVWEALVRIPYGITISYKDLARSIKKESAIRAVGNANGKNPIPIIIPCHRVIAHDGNLGGYSL